MPAKTTKKKTVKKTVAKKKTTTAPKKNLERFLCDVPGDKCFWANNGWIVRNVQELPSALENMSDETFAYHVNPGKNDFYNWVADVVGDATLAKSIKSADKRVGMIGKVEKRIKQLKR